MSKKSFYNSLLLICRIWSQKVKTDTDTLNGNRRLEGICYRPIVLIFSWRLLSTTFDSFNQTVSDCMCGLTLLASKLTRSLCSIFLSSTPPILKKTIDQNGGDLLECCITLSTASLLPWPSSLLSLRRLSSCTKISSSSCPSSSSTIRPLPLPVALMSRKLHVVLGDVLTENFN